MNKLTRAWIACIGLAMVTGCSLGQKAEQPLLSQNPTATVPSPVAASGEGHYQQQQQGAPFTGPSQYGPQAMSAGPNLTNGLPSQHAQVNYLQPPPGRYSPAQMQAFAQPASESKAAKARPCSFG